MVEIKDIITLLIGLFGGGTLVKVIAPAISSRRDDFTVLQNAWREEFEKLKSEMIDVKAQNLYLEKQVLSLSTQIATLKQILPDLPIPLWFKDVNGTMLQLNDAYEKAFLIPQGKHRGDYIGQSDEVIWGQDVADTFRENDAKALDSGDQATIIFEEERHSRLLCNWIFLKYPKIIDGVVVGIGGIAIPKKDKKVIHEVK